MEGAALGALLSTNGQRINECGARLPRSSRDRTFARSRPLRSGRAHGGGSARGAGTVPLQPTLRGARPQGSVVSHVRTFARSRPLRSGRAHGGGSARGAGTVPLQPTLRGARPQGSVVSHVRTFHVPTFTVHRSTSTVPRSIGPASLIGVMAVGSYIPTSKRYTPGATVSGMNRS